MGSCDGMSLGIEVGVLVGILGGIVMLVFLLVRWMDLLKEHQWDLPLVHETELLMDRPMVMQWGYLMAI